MKYIQIPTKDTHGNNLTRLLVLDEDQDICILMTKEGRFIAGGSQEGENFKIDKSYYEHKKIELHAEEFELEGKEKFSAKIIIDTLKQASRKLSLPKEPIPKTPQEIIIPPGTSPERAQYIRAGIVKPANT